MFNKKTIVFLVLILCSALGSLAQTTEENIKREEDEQRQKEFAEQFKHRAAPFIPDLREFVPKETDSWTVGIIRNGGWTHMTQIVAFAKSDGNFLCREDNLMKDHSIPQTDFDELKKLIQTVQFDSFEQQKTEDFDNCADCSVETLVFLRRELKKNRVRTYEFNMDDFAYGFGTSFMRNLYNHLKTINSCPE